MGNLQRTAVRALVLGALLGSTSSQAMQRVPEIPDHNLPDIAAVRNIPGRGPVILYNPALCKKAGRALCQFARAHEYGHIVLGHTHSSIDSRDKEREADIWAARHAPRHCTLAAYLFFSTGNGGSPTHGVGRKRAERLTRYLPM